MPPEIDDLWEITGGGMPLVRAVDAHPDVIMRGIPYSWVVAGVFSSGHLEPGVVLKGINRNVLGVPNLSKGNPNISVRMDDQVMDAGRRLVIDSRKSVRLLWRRSFLDVTRLILSIYV